MNATTLDRIATRRRRRAHLRQRLAAVAPAFAALLYPWWLDAAYAGAQRLDAGGLAAMAAWATLLLALALAFATPLLGLRLALRDAAHRRARTRRPGLAYLVVLVPPLYTLSGVETYLTGIDAHERALWVAGWLVIAAWAWRAPPPSALAASTPPAALRVVHGATAAVLLLGYIAMHLGNHVAGLWSAEAHLALMATLRGWYRHALVEPALVALMLLQVGTGLLLFRRWLDRRADAARVLQMATGAFLGFYLVCHLNSTFVYARAAEGIDTDFWFASGGAGGLLSNAWNPRLIPHYALAVLALVVHLALGLRVVLLAHGVARARLAALLPLAAVVGTVLALAATLPLLRVHLA